MKQLVPLSIFLILIFGALTFVIPPAVDAGIFGSALRVAAKEKIKEQIKEQIKERLAQEIFFKKSIQEIMLVKMHNLFLHLKEPSIF